MKENLLIKNLIKKISFLTIFVLAVFLFRGNVFADDAVPLIEITNSTPVINEPLQVSYSNVDGEVEYQWYRNDELISTGSSYTPTASDYESWIKVNLVQNGNVICNDSIYFSKLPVLYINTDDGQAITSKEEYKTGTMLTQGNSQYTNSSQLYNGVIEIKGRGNTSWGLPKKPYKIKLDSKTNLFGMGKNKHWVLIANYYDESLMRNKLVYDFSEQLGLVSMSSTWVDVVLNGEYVGNYQLCEHIRIGDTRIDIYNWEDTAADIASAVYSVEKKNGLSKTDKSNMEDALCEDFSWVTSGQFTYNGVTYTISNYYTDETFSSSTNLAKGIIFESSEEYDELTKFTTSNGLKVMVNSPEYLYTNENMYSYVQNLWQSYENAYVSSTGYNSDGTYYTEYSDLDSMVSYWLTMEVFGNNDGCSKSRYAYLDDDGLIKWGPVWDCDWGVGSVTVGNIPTGWKVTHGNPFKYFVTHDDFLEAAIAKYQEIRPQLLELVSSNGTIDEYYSYIYESGIANESLWKYSRGFENDVTQLKSYMTKRIAWLDTQFTDLSTLKTSLSSVIYTTKYNPIGNVEAITEADGSIKIHGWAYDPDNTSKSINVKAYIGTTCIGTLSTSQTRSDVNKVFNITGKHGFNGTLSTDLTGTQTVTIKAVDLGSGVEYVIGSNTVTLTTSCATKYNPIGNVEAVTEADGSIKVHGWAYDPDDASKSINVKAYIGTTCIGTLSANQTRSDVNEVFSITGKHGFYGTLSTTLSGTQTITIKAVDLGSGKEYTIGSKSVTLSSSCTTKYNPKGNVEAVTATAGSIKIAGWAYDPDDSNQSIYVKAYIGSTCLGTVNANITRTDVNNAFSISGKHGFSGNLSTTLTGTQTVTIKAVDLGSGAEYTIGSKTVTIPSAYTTKYNPIGNVEAVTAADGSITIGGWAYDPDYANQSISVKVYIGSTCLGTVKTNVARSDVNSKFSISGNHGFGAVLSTNLAGTQTVTIKAVDVGSGAEYTIGSKTVTIPSAYTTNYNPIGNVEAVTAADGSITIGGWAYDPDDANQSISVKVYIGSTCLGTVKTNVARPDVNSKFSISGNHGFGAVLSTNLTGTQTVTIKAVDVGSGAEYTIGSKSITIS